MKRIKIQTTFLLGLIILNSANVIAQGTCAVGSPWCTSGNNIQGGDVLGGDGSNTNPLYIQTNGTTRVTVAGNSNNVGIGTTSPSAMLSLDGNSARTIQMERHTTAASAGNNLTILAGGAKSAGTNLNGGDLLLISGTATGTGSSQIQFYTATAGATGTTDRTPSVKMTITGAGDIGIGVTSPGMKIDVKDVGNCNMRLQSTQAGAGNGNTYLQLNRSSNSQSSLIKYQTGLSGAITDDWFTGCKASFDYTIWNGSSSAANLMIQQSTGNVGIGTTSPNNLVQMHGGFLQVTNSTTGSGSGDGFIIGPNSSAAELNQQENAAMNFLTNGTQRMQIAAGGNVGIGDAAQSSGKLYVKNDYSTSSADNAIQVSATNSSGNAVGVNITATGTAPIGINNEVTGTGGSTGSFGSTYGMKIRNYAPQYNNNYGIYNILGPSSGATSGGTGYYSTVTGTSGSTTESNMGISVETTNGNNITGVYGGAYYGNGNNFGGSFKGFADVNTDQSIGAYGYAESSGTTGCPTVTGVMGEVYKTSTQTGNYVGLMGSANGYDGAGGVRLAAQINGSGTYSGTWTQSSDIILKKDINPLTGSLALVLQISPKTYRYKTDIYKNVNLASGIHAGVIAQELQQILPGLVESSFAPAYHDPESGIDYDTVSFKTVNYIEIIPYLIGAIQEQQAQIQALQANPKPAQPASSNQKEIKLSEKPSVILEQNNPNPFKENTTINYNIPEDTKQAQLLFYNSKGNVISTVEITEKGAGSLLVYGSDLSSGIYTYTLLIDNRVVETKKMMKVK